MPKLPKFVENHMHESTLGRTQLKLYEVISGQKHWLPGEPEKRRFIREEFRNNPVVGKIFLTLLIEGNPTRFSFKDVVPPADIRRLLRHLAKQPFDDQLLIEVSNCPRPLPKSVGVCIHRESLANGGDVYVCTIFDDKNFPTEFLGLVEVRSCLTKPYPIFSVLSGTDFEPYNEADYNNSWIAEFVIKILGYLDENRPTKLLPLSQANKVKFSIDKIHNPPEDPLCTLYIARVLKHEMPCTLASVPMKRIEPFSLDFCLTYPMETIKWEIEQIKHGDTARMIVYWDGDHFVMSDDYSVYLAYRFLESSLVPVAILGEFPRKVVTKVLTIGGPELIPPFRLMQKPDYRSLPNKIKNWLIDTRLQHKKISSQLAMVQSVVLVLAEILFDPRTDEKRIHEFLSHYPIVMDAYGSFMRSELRLGSQYRVDLAIQYNLDEKRLLLIELENPKASIFTTKGRPRSHVTHALQQVEDWLQWWREHPNDVPTGFDPSIPIEGLVVIGRNTDLTSQDRRRLLHLNSTRHVKLITYDELFAKFETLIQNLEAIA
jgi:hypothetical protein